MVVLKNKGTIRMFGKYSSFTNQGEEHKLLGYLSTSLSSKLQMALNGAEDKK